MVISMLNLLQRLHWKLRPDYEGIETMGFGLCQMMSCRRYWKLRPDYEGIETFFLWPEIFLSDQLLIGN